MITYTVNDIKPVAQQLCDGLAGQWVIASMQSPYIVAEMHELVQEIPPATDEELEMLRIMEDNIRNGDHLSE